MHRSGTSLVTKSLHDLGITMGWRRERNEEAWLFLGLNQWLLAQAGGSWECPEAIGNVLDCPEVRRTATEYLRLILGSPHAISFLGPLGWLRWGSVLRMGRPWGWKDPRTTFTLPLWLDLFPEAKVIHVCRHGVDVAQSLKKRHEGGYARLAHRFALSKPLYWLWKRQTPLVPSGRCSTLEGGFTLWEQYTAEGRRHVKALGNRALELKYEEFLDQPQQHLERLLEFCGTAATAEGLDRAIAGIRRERAYAHKASAELKAFAQQKAAQLAAFGYGAETPV